MAHREMRLERIARFIRIGLSVVLTTCAGMVAAAANEGGRISVEHAWARASVPGASVGAVYLRIRNTGNRRESLMGASSPKVAARIELHSHVLEGGLMRMRRIDKVEIPAGGVAELKPHGMHLMLFELRQPLKSGDKIPLTLEFQRAGKTTVEVSVQAIDAPAPGH